MALTNEKAYVLGLLTGGGTIANGTFKIVMPFDKWGADPATASAISHDLLTKVRTIFDTAYGLTVNYTLGNKGRWIIQPIGNPSLTQIVTDLGMLGLPVLDNLLDTADLVSAKANLVGMRAEHFLTGIFDARASLTESHRRFNDDSPVVSIEIPGSTMNFKFVVQLCAWLTDLGSITDQILFNHPCQHATSDPTYPGWKKGFKIRFLAKSFISTHSFAMKAKAADATALAGRQQTEEQTPCIQRQSAPNTVSIHDDIKCQELPTEVRGKLFLHYHHICAAMGCPHAPVAKVIELVKQATSHVCVHPRLSKGGYEEIKVTHTNIATTDFTSGSVNVYKSTCSSIIQNYRDYPDIQVALAYLLSSTLNGKRHVGSMRPILDANANIILETRVISGFDRAPLFVGISSSDRGALLSCPTGGANATALESKIFINGIDISVR